MTFSQSYLHNSPNKLAYVVRLLNLLKQELKTKTRPNWKVNLKYWYRAYIKWQHPCPHCAEEWTGRLKWGDDWCRHDAGGGGIVHAGIGMKMGKEEWDARSEGILDYDTQKGIENGEIRTAADLQTFAKENGWNEPGEEKLVKKMQQKYRLR